MIARSYPISRVHRPRSQAKHVYDRYSRWYDWIGGMFERKYARIGVEQLAVQKGENVLEIGYGTGHMLVVLAKKVETSGKVWGIDISEGMFKIARRRILKNRIAERVNIRCGDAINLPYDSHSFNKIFMSFTLELFDTPDIPSLLQECHRVLQNKGQIGVVALSKKGLDNSLTRFYEKLHYYFAHWIDCRPIYLAHILTENRFEVIKENLYPMFGLQVEIIIAMPW